MSYVKPHAQDNETATYTINVHVEMIQKAKNITERHILGFGRCVWLATTRASIASPLLSHSSRPVELRSPTTQFLH